MSTDPRTAPDPDLLRERAQAHLEGVTRNLERVRARVDAACAAAGRDDRPTLVAVSKSVGPDLTAAVVLAGALDLGENRAQAFVEKHAALDGLRPAPRWHFIGHLQRNKARRVVERADVVHSVDSPRLAEALARLTSELERPLEVFVEVDLTGEAAKHGHAPDELAPTLGILAAAPHIGLLGLMAMGPLEERPGRTTEHVFAEAASLGASLAEEHPDAFVGGRCRLSMGMSGDLEIAVRHGATHVRVGSALFEGLPRPQRP